ncbi:MAG: hypothetical protein ABL962_17880 [Fimbriimonadaceae bacterium]
MQNRIRLKSAYFSGLRAFWCRPVLLEVNHSKSLEALTLLGYSVFRVAHPAGIEPVSNADSIGLAEAPTHKEAHKLSEMAAQLSEIAGAWAELPPPLKAAILAIVRTDKNSRHVDMT